MRTKLRWQVVIPVLGITTALGVWQALSQNSAAQVEKTAGDRQSSIQAFAVVASVLMSPRCLNCHIPGESPLQGDAGTPHNMNVKRGSDGRGTPAMRCSNCHQEENSSQLHGPPGRSGWRLPPPSMPLAWQGLTIGELCRSVRDPATNGNKNPAQLIEHVSEDPFVNWGWNPGPGRSIPPVSHEEFVSAVTAWLDAGAYCPQ